MSQRTLGFAFAFVLFVSCAKRSERPAAPTSGPSKAKLRGITGTVAVKRATGDEWVEGTDGMELYESDKVRTGRGAMAQVDFGQGSLVSLNEDALIAVAVAQRGMGSDKADLTVLKGKINAETERPGEVLTVSTPAATIRAGREIVFR